MDESDVNMRIQITLSAVLILVHFLSVHGGNADELQRTGAWPYGSSSAVEVDMDRPLVYLGSGGAVLALDVSDVTDPVLMSQSARTSGLVRDLVYDEADSVLYAACGDGGMEIWDMSDPAYPLRLSMLELLYFGVETPVGNIALSGEYIVAECNFGGVHTVDVSDPANPEQVAFNAAMGNPALDVSVDSSGTAHTTGAQYYMRLAIDPDGTISNIGQKEFIYGASTAFGNDEVAYVSYEGYMYILDLLISGFPAWSVTDVGGFTDIASVEDHVLLVNNDGLQIWNVSSYSSPVLTGSLSQIPDYADRINVKGEYAYVTNSNEGLSIIDISDLSDPMQTGSYDVYSVTWDMAVQGSYGFVAHSDDGLLVLDLSDPSLPELAGQSVTEAEARDIDLEEDYAYLAAWTDGLRIIDISSPDDPQEVSSWEQFDAWRVLCRGDVVWAVEAVANQTDTLHSLDVSDPASPSHIGSIPLYELTWQLIGSGDRIYVASDD